MGRPIGRESLALVSSLVGHSPRSDPEGLLRLVARTGFEGMNRASLLRLATHEGLELPAGESVFGILWSLLAHALPDIGEEERLGMIRGRCRAPAKDVEKLLEVDGAIETLDKSDAQQLKAESKKCKELEIVRGEFKKDYEKKSEEFRRARAKAKPAGRGSRGARPGAASSSSSRPRLPAGELSQAVVKGLLPPGCFVWQAWQHQSWHFHIRPHPRFSFPWRASDCRTAAIEGVRCAWSLYLADHGLPESACHVQGLFS